MFALKRSYFANLDDNQICVGMVRKESCVINILLIFYGSKFNHEKVHR